MSNEATVAGTTKLRGQAEAISKVLGEENILGGSGNRKWDDFETDAFVRQVVSYAEEGARWGYLELTYSGPSARIIIRASKLDNEYEMRSIDVVDHPYNNENIDYARATTRSREAAGLPTTRPADLNY